MSAKSVPAIKAALRIYRELQSTQCACGAPKRSGQSFCRVHYMALPVGTRTALYDLDEYPETYRRACGLLGLQEPSLRKIAA